MIPLSWNWMISKRLYDLVLGCSGLPWGALGCPGACWGLPGAALGCSWRPWAALGWMVGWQMDFNDFQLNSEVGQMFSG